MRSALLHAAAVLAATTALPAIAADTPLDMGDYVCEQGLKAQGRTPKGTVQLRADGTYSYMNGGHKGRYKYDPATRRLTWLSGWFADNQPSATEFKAGRRVSQLDLTFSTRSGPLYWSCGHNK